jgi:copper(I)-binding protein
LLVAALPVAVAMAPPASAPSLLVVGDAWARKTPGADVAAVYLSLSNKGTSPIIVIGASSPAASNAMVHETSVVNGQSQMRMKDKIVIAPGQTVDFAPGGLHLMLSGLKSKLSVGQTLPLVLLTADGAQIAVAAVIKPLVP